LDQQVLSILLMEHMPSLAAHLQVVHFPLAMISLVWFLNLYIKVFPWEVTMRILDMFFLKGSIVFFQVALALFKINEVEILKYYDINEIFELLNRSNIVADTLFKVAFEDFADVSPERIVRLQNLQRIIMFQQMRKDSSSAAGIGKKAVESSSDDEFLITISNYLSAMKESLSTAKNLPKGTDGASGHGRRPSSGRPSEDEVEPLPGDDTPSSSASPSSSIIISPRGDGASSITSRSLEDPTAGGTASPTAQISPSTSSSSLLQALSLSPPGTSGVTTAKLRSRFRTLEGSNSCIEVSDLLSAVAAVSSEAIDNTPSSSSNDSTSTVAPISPLTRLNSLPDLLAIAKAHTEKQKVRYKYTQQQQNDPRSHQRARSVHVTAMAPASPQPVDPRKPGGLHHRAPSSTN